ncbi:hypothetical protein D0C28_07510 [Rhizobium sp. AU243]|nr:hypothetical protein D0C28_07510 [Rhizobium sp. AU243]
MQAILQDSENDIDLPKRKELADAAEKAVEVLGRQQFFALRHRWSTAMVWWISILIGFNIAITVAVGANRLNFDNLQWFITAVLVQTFLQIVGLGYVAVNYLFRDKISIKEKKNS